MSKTVFLNTTRGFYDCFQRFVEWEELCEQQNAYSFSVYGDGSCSICSDTDGLRYSFSDFDNAYSQLEKMVTVERELYELSGRLSRDELIILRQRIEEYVG